MIIDETNNINIKITKGDSFSFIFEVENMEQELKTAYFTCKNNADEKAKLFQKSLTNGITKLEGGKYIVKLSPRDTELIEVGQYPYDLQIGVDDEIYTIIKGNLMIDYDVTKEG
jgi:hypothetical protein|nr:MAG TPA: hypothetical protein [Caudoviricetes sp.]